MTGQLIGQLILWLIVAVIVIFILYWVMNWLYRRSIHLALEAMRDSGWGEPPAGYCVLTLGSAARHESLLHPDQDNAMIVADYPDARHDEIDGFFQALGERFTETLGEAGIPLCQGHVMARWPMWRKRLSEWQDQLHIWTGDRRVKRVQQSNILLDFHPVHGDAGLAEDLRDSVVALVPRAGLFLDELAALLDETPVALDRLGAPCRRGWLSGPLDRDQALTDGRAQVDQPVTAHPLPGGLGRAAHAGRASAAPGYRTR